MTIDRAILAAARAAEEETASGTVEGVKAAPAEAPYGRSRAMDALPDLRARNDARDPRKCDLQSAMRAAADRAGAYEDRPNPLMEGRLTAARVDGGEWIPPLLDYAVTPEDVERVRQGIGRFRK